MSLSRLVFRVGYGIRLYRFLIIAFLSSLWKAYTILLSNVGENVVIRFYIVIKWRQWKAFWNYSPLRLQILTCSTALLLLNIIKKKCDIICSNANIQVICSSYPISWPSFKPLAQIVFRDILLTISECSNLQRAITPVKFDGIFWKGSAGNLLIIPYQLTKFQAPSSNVFFFFFFFFCWQVLNAQIFKVR